ncbi:Putative ribonuclease H protein At1g65750 [Linum perenne]
MVKLAFLFIQKPELLWVQILHTKYFKEVNGELRPRNTKSQSALWRGICRSWNFMLVGARSGIRDGTGTAFWTDWWLESGTKLIDYIQEPDDDLNLCGTVKDLVLEDGNWNLAFIHQYLNEEVITEIIGMSPPKESQGEDDSIWGLEANGKFSVRTAYGIIHEMPNPRPKVDWKSVWKWQGPGRIQYFLWLVVQGKLLKNLERKRRHLTEDGSCPRCGAAEE